MKRLSLTRSFPVDQAQLVATLIDPAFLAAKNERFGAGGAPRVHNARGRAVLEIPRQLPMAQVPSAVRGLLPADGQVTQVEEWELDDDPPASRWRVELGNLPAAVAGAGVVEPGGEPGSCRYVVTGAITIRVPLIGTRLEGEVAGHLQSLIEAEMEFTRGWLRTAS